MELTNRRRTLIFAVIVFTVLLSSMLATALTTALPAIMEDLHITAGTGQWLTSVFSLVQGILVLCTAYLVKRFPAKPLYLTAICCFTAGVILDAFAPSFAVMMAGRIFQAAGNGTLSALGQVILLTVYPKQIHGSVMGTYGLACGAAPIIAPTIAGLIVDLWGWRMIFYGLIVLCFVSITISSLTMKNVVENVKIPLDAPSVLLAFMGFGGLLYGVGNIGTGSFFSFSIGGTVLLGIAGCIIFAQRQWTLKTPFLNIRILKNRRLTAAVIGSVLFYFNMIALSVMVPVYIQDTCGHSAMESGLFMMPGSIIMACLSPVMGRIYDKVGIRKLFIGGGALLAIGTLGAGLSNGNMLVFVIFNCLRSASVAMLMMPLLTWGVSELSAEEIPSGQALITSLRIIAGAFGAAVFMEMETVLSERVGTMPAMQITFTAIAAVGVAVFVLGCVSTRRGK